MKASRTMVVEVGLPLPFWVEELKTACYTQNKSIILKHHVKTAYELLKGRKPDIPYFHVFRCVCQISSQKDQRSNIKAKAEKGFFLEYSSESKALR